MFFDLFCGVSVHFSTISPSFTRGQLPADQVAVVLLPCEGLELRELRGTQLPALGEGPEIAGI